MMMTYYLNIGSNLDDREGNLWAADLRKGMDGLRDAREKQSLERTRVEERKNNVQKEIDDLISEINIRTAKKQRVLVTTLTIKMAESLTSYLLNAGIRVRAVRRRPMTRTSAARPSSATATRCASSSGSAASTAWRRTSTSGSASRAKRR